MMYFKAFLIFFFGISEIQFSDGAVFRTLTTESDSQDGDDFWYLTESDAKGEADFRYLTESDSKDDAVLQNLTKIDSKDVAVFRTSDSHSTVREYLLKNGPCELHEFRCANDQCIDRKLHCNGRRDCDDNFDEEYCQGGWRKAECPKNYPFFDCGQIHGNNRDQCIPLAWVCDGVLDCKHTKRDEADCTTESLINQPYINPYVLKQVAVKWVLGLRKSTRFLKWSDQVHHIVVALHLGYPLLEETTKTELAYEVTLQFLAKWVLKKTEGLQTAEIAQYVNAFLASCINPRKFFTQDLVAELRMRVDAQTYTNPYVMVALCNAGDEITEEDVQKLLKAFKSNHKDVWTDTQAYAVMALACAASQTGSAYNLRNIGSLTMELKNKQLKNGTVDNLKTTALVLQALFAAGDKDEENFDEEKAMKLLTSKLLKNGSFDDVTTAYYVLPLFNRKSLIDLSFDRCTDEEEDEFKGFKDFIDQGGEEGHMQYTLWIGDKKELQRTMNLLVPAGTSLYGVMETAAQMDFIYRFKYNMKNGKPYIYSLANIDDDPENEKFWFPYTYMIVNNAQKLVPMRGSPADIKPRKDQHVIFWYKSASWK